MNQWALVYAGGAAAIPVVARLWVRYRRNQRQKREYNLPLFDGVLLEIAFTPRPGDHDDPDVLAEIRETLAHLNRRMYADEFWKLDEQLGQYYERLPEPSRPTMRRALIRLIEQPDRWLQSIGAKTSARLHLAEAAGPIRALLDKEAGADARFQAEMEKALESLETWPAEPAKS